MCERVVTANEVIWYDWKTFLEQFYKKKIPKVSQAHHVTFDREDPDKVFFRQLATSPWFDTQFVKPANAARAKLAYPHGFELTIPPIKPGRRKQLEDVVKKNFEGEELEALVEEFYGVGR